MATHKPTFLGRLSITLLILIFGVPVGYLLLMFSWGVIGIPFVVALYAAPWFLLHYFVWGRAFSKQLEFETERTVGCSDSTPADWAD